MKGALWEIVVDKLRWRRGVERGRVGGERLREVALGERGIERLGWRRELQGSMRQEHE